MKNNRRLLAFEVRYEYKTDLYFGAYFWRKDMIFMDIGENISRIREKIAEAARKSGRKSEDITLVAVTKTHEPDMINEALKYGIRDIGENRAQEIVRKYPDINPVRWHLIGHLQTNKVKYIIDKADLIHSVDSVRLMDEINRRASEQNKIMEALIQINISGEQTKFGIKPQELDELLEYAGKCANLRISGLMTIAPKINGDASNRLHFANIYKIYIDNRAKKYDNVDMKYLSMGMSGDFEDAILEGANVVRIGSAIFGQRN